MSSPKKHSLLRSLNSLKKARVLLLAIPCILLVLSWVFFKFQLSIHVPSNMQNQRKWSKNDDQKDNLVRFLPPQLSKDKRGWMLNPVTAAATAGLSGGAVICASVSVGEIRAGQIRGNHRHRTSNETFIIWGAQVIFRLEKENPKVGGKGYAESIIGADEVGIATSPAGRAHALVNIDPVRTAYRLGCQDGIVNPNSSTTVFNIWTDL